MINLGCRNCRQFTGGCGQHFSSWSIPTKLGYGYGSTLRCPKHNELVACPECLEEEGSEMSNILYKNL